MNEIASPFPALSHDHDDCVRQALDAAEARCVSQGARLTTLRRRVLELVWGNHAPVGAYALLDALKAEGYAAAPPTVYRALDFLLEQGLVHRVECLNAYIGCPRPEAPHAALLLLCSECGRAAELDNATVRESLFGAAASLGFTIARQTLEIQGLCAECQGHSHAGHGH